MTKIHLQAAARLQRELDSLEKSVGVLEQAGWMPIPKPLTGEAIAQIAERVGLLGAKSRAGNAHDAAEKLVRAVERAHGIGEK